MSGGYWSKRCLLVACVLQLSGCTRYVGIDDPSLTPFADMYAVNRTQYGMSALPRHARVFVDRDYFGDPASRGYDVMLHIYDKAFHHVAFRRDGDRYKWVGEQEQCWGPRDFDTVNGRFKEDLNISYFQHAANHLNGLHIRYTGPDQALSSKELSVGRVHEILKEWGCE